MNPDSISRMAIMDSLMGGLTSGIMGDAVSAVAEAIVIACIAQANGPAVDAQAVFRAARDKDAVKSWERGTDVEKGIARAFATCVDAVECMVDTVEMFSDAGIAHPLIESAITNYALMVHVRNGFAIFRPDGSKLEGVLPNGEKVDL